jgi:hypothetical protein
MQHFAKGSKTRDGYLRGLSCSIIGVPRTALMSILGLVLVEKTDDPLSHGTSGWRVAFVSVHEHDGWRLFLRIQLTSQIPVDLFFRPPSGNSRQAICRFDRQS